MLKVGLTGAHGMGKTTLSRELSSRLSHKGVSVQVTPEVPREIVREAGDPHFFRRGHNSIAKQFLIITRQILAEYELNGMEISLCDRTLLDHWCYTLALFPHFDEEKTRSIWNTFIIEYQKTYQLLLYIPIEFGAVDDGVRESNLHFQAEIDSLIRNQLNAAGLPYIVVSGTPEARANLSEELILSRFERDIGHG